MIDSSIRQMCSAPYTSLKSLKQKQESSSIRHMILYGIAILCAFITGFSEITWLHQFGIAISEIFVKVFKCLSLPLISLSLFVTITGYDTDHTITKLGKKIVGYTIGTTIIATVISCVLYLAFNPAAQSISIQDPIDLPVVEGNSYWIHINSLVPSNIFEPFIKHQVMSVLLMTIVLACAVRFIPNKDQKASLINVLQGLHSIFMTLTKWVVVLIPLALYGFVTVSILEFNKGLDLSNIGQYLIVVVLANLIQGVIVLPLWLKWKGISPGETARGMIPALSLAFFSKSSSGTLPVTINCLTKLNVSPKIAQFVLPLCTTINMNGCAAFIFATVLFVSQSNGVTFTFIEIISWILIATIAAIGNAGIPMGCFFLSASLLANMGVPLTLLGIILPFYSLLDMIETTLNVWSDACVTRVTVKSQGV